MQPSMLGHHFEDFEVGEIIIYSLSKTISESDIILFSLLIMNHLPVHTNFEYVQNKQHGGIFTLR